VYVNVTLRRDRVIIVAVEKQEVLHIPSVSVALAIQQEISRILQGYRKRWTGFKTAIT
jgi:hypothetical protein